MASAGELGDQFREEFRVTQEQLDKLDMFDYSAGIVNADSTAYFFIFAPNRPTAKRRLRKALQKWFTYPTTRRMFEWVGGNAESWVTNKLLKDVRPLSETKKTYLKERFEEEYASFYDDLRALTPYVYVSEQWLFPD